MDEKRVSEIAMKEADSALDRRSNSAYRWVIALLILNLCGAGRIIILLDQASSDRFTGAMAVTSEWKRAQANPGYAQVDIRGIQDEALKQR